MENYIAQRLAAINAGNSDAVSELDALRAENERLKQQLSQTPQASFKSEAQAAFEQSPEFEQLLGLFYMRFLRDKFGAEFRASPHNQDFQHTANKAFEQYEKSINKGVPENAQAGKKNSKASGADAGENA